MSGECDKCGEHCLDCSCHKAIKIPLTYDFNIKIKESYKKLFINLDQTDFELITIIRHGKEIYFPTWEFWQILESQHNEFK